jgi:hypothetical protein
MASALLPVSGDAVVYDSAPVDISRGPRSTNLVFASGKWPSTEDWTRNQQLIKRLYVDEDRTLKDVMAIMERDHGHKAT